jgi:SNF2 family DNA or RNA helicase
MISVDFISARMPAEYILAPVTIIGIWQKKMRKFDPLARVARYLGNHRQQLLKNFREC